MARLDSDPGHAALRGTRIGLEKESLRVDPNGHIAQTPHPEALGSALTWLCGASYGTFVDIRYKHFRHHVDNDDVDEDDAPAPAVGCSSDPEGPDSSWMTV